MMWVESEAWIATFCAVISAPSRMNARVCSFITCTGAEPAMPAVEPPEPAAATVSTDSDEVASSPRVPPATITESAPTNACTVSSWTSVVLETPTPAELVPMDTVPAIIKKSAVSSAASEISPPALMVASSPI